MKDIKGYSSLTWVIIFGESGWDAINTLKRNGESLRQHLVRCGRHVLNFPHFAQNFQQRAIFCLAPDQDDAYLKGKPQHLKYAPAARQMRAAVLAAIEQTTGARWIGP